MKPSFHDVRVVLWCLVPTLVVVSALSYWIVGEFTGRPHAALLRAEAGDGSVNLSWEYADDVQPAGWELQRRDDGDEYRATRKLRGTVRNHVVEDLINGRTYFFRVRARNQEGERKPWSAEKPAIPTGIESASAQSLVRIEETLSGIHRLLSGSDDPSKKALRCNTVLGDVLFEFQEAKLTTSAAAILKRMVEWLVSTKAGGPVIVTGYASAMGPASYNLNLSEDRASAVRGFLDAGVDNVEFIEVAKGERHDQPIAGKESRENQRVVVTLCGQ